MRGEGDIGDARSVGPCQKGNNRSGGGNEEMGRQQGREDKRGHMMQGRTQKNQAKKSLRVMKEGGLLGMGSAAFFQKGPGRREILPTHLRGAFLWNLDTQPG